MEGESVEIEPGLKVEVENYASVKGENPDTTNEAVPGNWLVLELTRQDGSEILGYISISSQTAANISIKGSEKSHTVTLNPNDSSQNPDDINRVRVIPPPR